MNRVARITCIIVACCCLTSSALAERVTYALAVGNNQPPAEDPSLRPLRFADDDAVRYHQLFSRLAHRSQVLTVMDLNTQRRYPALAPETRPPTLARFRAALQEYRAPMQQDQRRGKQPVLLLTFSGHGTLTEGGEYGLVFLDGALTRQMLYDEVLSGLDGVQVHLLIDACHAAGVVGARGPFDREVDAHTVTLGASQRHQWLERHSLGRFPNVGALVAASSTEETHEWSRIEAGVFSYQVLSALLGAADVNADYRIEYSEVQAFVAAASRSLAVEAAKPSVLAYPPAADQRAVLLDLLELPDTTFLSGIPEGLGHFYVETSQGSRLLEAHLEGSPSVLLALPRVSAGLYLRSSNQEARIPLLPLVKVAQLHFTPIQEQRRGSVDNDLRRGLFAAPYGPGYYRGYVDSQGLPPVEFGPPRALPASQGPAPRRPSPPLQSSTSTRRALVTADSTSPQVGTRSRWPALALAILSGTALVTSGSLGLVALDKRRDFDRTEKQRPARELANGYALFGNASLAAAAVGVGAGVGAFLLWPGATIPPTPGRTQAGWEIVLGKVW
ncbi:caspase family protein [Myxococcota bacterium]